MVVQIYNKLDELFGQGVRCILTAAGALSTDIVEQSTDIFQMEFVCQNINRNIGRLTQHQPARLLEQGNFDYAGSDSLNAQQIKPPPVIDAEFRLANDMFALSNIFGGASGGQVCQGPSSSNQRQ